jgi:HEAT repeat protein
MPEMPLMPETPFGFAFAGQAGQSADPETRLQQEVFRSLLRNNADRAIDLATERLKTNPADPVVLGNLGAIATSGSAKAQPLLLTIAKTSTSTPARRDATMSIVRNRDDKDALALLEDLYKANADNVEVRRVVVSSIGRMSDPRAVTVLANIVRNDTDESIRRSAIRALGSRQDQESMKVLEELLKQAPPRRG